MAVRGSRLSSRPSRQQRLDDRGKSVVATGTEASRPPPDPHPARRRQIGATPACSRPRRPTTRRRRPFGFPQQLSSTLAQQRWPRRRQKKTEKATAIRNKQHSPSSRVTGEAGALLANRAMVSLPARTPPLILLRSFNPGNLSRNDLSDCSASGLPPTLPRLAPPLSLCLPSLCFPTTRVLPLTSIFSTFCNEDK